MLEVAANMRGRNVGCSESICRSEHSYSSINPSRYEWTAPQWIKSSPSRPSWFSTTCISHPHGCRLVLDLHSFKRFRRKMSPVPSLKLGCLPSLRSLIYWDNVETVWYYDKLLNHANCSCKACKSWELQKGWIREWCLDIKAKTLTGVFISQIWFLPL